MVRMIHKRRPSDRIHARDRSRRSSAGKPLEIISTYNDITNKSPRPLPNRMETSRYIRHDGSGLAYVRLIHNEAGDVVDFGIVGRTGARRVHQGAERGDSAPTGVDVITTAFQGLVRLNLGIRITGRAFFGTKNLLFSRCFRILISPDRGSWRC